MLLLAVLPWMTALLDSIPDARDVTSFIRMLYGFQCHQRHGRALSLLATELPVCARCTGIYLGLGLAALVGRPRLRPDLYKAWLLVGGLLLFLDVATEWVGMRAPAAGLRVATGAFLSYAVGLTALLAVRR